MSAAAIAVALVAVLALQATILVWPRVGPVHGGSARGIRSWRLPLALEPRTAMWRVAVVVIGAGHAAPITWRMRDPEVVVYGGNDLSAHSAWAQEVVLVPPGVPVPHFALHVVARVVMVPLGLERADAAVTVAVVLAVALGAWLLTGFVGARATGRAGIVTATVGSLVVLVGEAPNALVQPPSEIGYGSGYLVLHQWATPTNALLLPVALLLVPRVLAAIDGPVTRRDGGVIAGVVVVGMVAKPSAPLVLVPAAVALAAVSATGWRELARRSWPLVRWGFIPLVVTGALQAWWYASGLGGADDGGFRLAPLHEMRIAGALRPAAWIALTVPAVLLVVAGGRFWRDRSIQLGLMALLVGVAQFALLGETGARRDHANWGISLYVGFLVLLVVAVRRAVERLSVAWSCRAPQAGVRVAVAGGVSAVLLVGGSAAWVDSVGLG